MKVPDPTSPSTSLSTVITLPTWEYTTLSGEKIQGTSGEFQYDTILDNKLKEFLTTVVETSWPDLPKTCRDLKKSFQIFKREHNIVGISPATALSALRNMQLIDAVPEADDPTFSNPWIVLYKPAAFGLAGMREVLGNRLFYASGFLVDQGYETMDRRLNNENNGILCEFDNLKIDTTLCTHVDHG
ncbi:hypothetical protein HK096_006068, partial [Nowakowskiella sp. JEL0078]